MGRWLRGRWLRLRFHDCRFFNPRRRFGLADIWLAAYDACFALGIAPERARLIADDVQYYAQLREPNEELERYCSIANQEPEGQ